MNVLRTSVVCNGRRIPLGKGKPIFSSSESAWSGFLVEEIRAPSIPRAALCKWPSTHLVLVKSGELQIEFTANGKRHQFIATPPSVTIWPKGYMVRRYSCAGASELLVVSFDPSTLQRLMRRFGGLFPGSLAPQMAIRDETIISLLLSMEGEIKSACPGGTAFGELLSVALAAYVSRRYSVEAGRETRRPLGTENGELRKVLEYIEAHIASDLTLEVLAEVARLSPHHLCHLFKDSLGISIHQYVLKERIRVAKQILVEEDTTLADTAMATGFANQSHFTVVFRRYTGTTPRKYRQTYRLANRTTAVCNTQKQRPECCTRRARTSQA